MIAFPLRNRDAVDERYFATNKGEGIVVKTMMEVRVLICKPRSLVAFCSLYKEGVVYKYYFVTDPLPGMSTTGWKRDL